MEPLRIIADPHAASPRGHPLRHNPRMCAGGLCARTWSPLAARHRRTYGCARDWDVRRARVLWARARVRSHTVQDANGALCPAGRACKTLARAAGGRRTADGGCWDGENARVEHPLGGWGLSSAGERIFDCAFSPHRLA